MSKQFDILETSTGGNFKSVRFFIDLPEDPMHIGDPALVPDIRLRRMELPRVLAEYIHNLQSENRTLKATQEAR